MDKDILANSSNSFNGIFDSEVGEFQQGVHFEVKGGYSNEELNLNKPGKPSVYLK